VGYKPKKPGRASHHPIMAFIADLRMVAHSWLRPGNAGSSNGAKTFLSETMEILGKHRIGLLRADAGILLSGLGDEHDTACPGSVAAVSRAGGFRKPH